MDLLSIRYLPIRHTTETGSKWVGKTNAANGEFRVAIVSNRGKHILSAHYVFGVKSIWGW